MNCPPQSNNAKRKTKKADRQTEYFDENEKPVKSKREQHSIVRNEPASAQCCEEKGSMNVQMEKLNGKP